MKINRNKKIKKTEISFIKFFFKLYKKYKKDVKKYRKFWEINEPNVFYFDICLDKKNLNFFKKVDIYDSLNEIFENFDVHYIIHTLKKNTWFATYYDDTQLDYAGQPIGNYGIQIFKISKRNKIKTLKIIFDKYI